MKIVQALKDSNILLKGITGILSMLLGTLAASLLGSLLTGKGTIRAGAGIVRAGYGSSIKKRKL